MGGRLDATVNEVVLTAIAGALRRFLGRRPGSVDDAPLRVALPAQAPRPAERGLLGNRASAWIVSLPTNLPDPGDRLARVRAETDRVAARPHPRGTEMLLGVADTLGGSALRLAVRLRHRLHSYNLIITSIPGPRSPRWLAGARLLEAYPHIPLFQTQALGIAVASYDGALHVGLTADWEVIPTLPELADDIETSLAELRALAPPPPLSVVRSG